jgi:hypothetical protein
LCFWLNLFIAILRRADKHINRGWTGHTTYAEDGDRMMHIASHVQFYIYGLLQLCLWFVNQLPKRYEVQINRTDFIKSFSYAKEGVRTSIPDWKGGPGYSNESNPADSEFPYQNRGRAEAAREWALHTQKYGVTIPSVVVGGAVDANGMLIGGRPSTEKLRGMLVIHSFWTCAFYI